MISDFLTERKKLVFALDSAEKNFPIGRLIDGVVDPDTGKIRAWWIESFEGLRVIMPEDIVSWNRDRIQIRSEQDLGMPEDLPKLKQVFQKEVPIVEARAFVDRKYIGKVKSFSFNTNFSMILSFRVKGKWWISSSRIISAKMVQKITKKGVFFSSPVVKVADRSVAKSKGMLPEVEMDKKIPEIFLDK